MPCTACSGSPHNATHSENFSSWLRSLRTIFVRRSYAAIVTCVRSLTLNFWTLFIYSWPVCWTWNVAHDSRTAKSEFCRLFYLWIDSSCAAPLLRRPIVSQARLSHGEERVWSNSHQALVLHISSRVLNEVGMNMIGWLPLKCLALQVACQKKAFATKSINTPSMLDTRWWWEFDQTLSLHESLPRKTSRPILEGNFWVIHPHRRALIAYWGLSWI